MNIVLIGMPGSGKSTLGKSVAKSLGMEFLDTDVLIEQHERRPITEIFKSDGEAYFRELESRVVETVLRVADADAARPDAKLTKHANHTATKRKLMLSVGGGAAEDPGNAKLLKKIGAVIFIDRPLEALERNIVYNGKRPLLSDKEKLVELYERRKPLYENLSDRVVDNGGGFEDASAELMRVAKLMGAGPGYLVIGDPIAHTLSPRLHGAIIGDLRALRAQRARGADAAFEGISYGAARVPMEKLEDSVADMRFGSVMGMNVTIPLKKGITRFLDELKGDAAVSGAVNTVVKSGERLIGYNTDMEGLKLALEAHGRSYAGANVIVCGTGGAASGIVCKAASEGAAGIYIVGRKEERAVEIAEAAMRAARFCTGDAAERATGETGVEDARDATFAQRGFTTAADACGVTFIKHDFTEPYVSPALADALAATDILINATPLGMDGTGKDFNAFLFLDKLPKDSFIYDLVYKPRETALVKAARERGLGAEGGLSMLIYQGILADELFFGIETDRKALYEAALNATRK
jgi:shikimate dehydrogenase